MSVDDQRTAGLPDGVADGLRDLARARIEGTTPWPRVRTAVRRDRRRRGVLAGAASAGVVVAVVGVAGGLLPHRDPGPVPADRGDRREQVSATPTPTPAASPRALGPEADPMNLRGGTVGALASDDGWLAGLRAEVVEDGGAARAADVRVLWAADHGEQRFAITASRADAANARLTMWRGPAGASPGDMRVGARDNTRIPATDPYVDPIVYQLRSNGSDGGGPGLMVATGTGLMAADAATGDADVDTAGRRVLSWSPLAPEGAVFVREASEAELDTMIVRGAGRDGVWFRLGGRTSTDGPEPLSAGFAAVSSPGTDMDVLTCAGTAFSEERGGFPSTAEPVLGATPRDGGEWFGLAVARAPSGGYLLGLCRSSLPERSDRAAAASYEGFVVPAPPSGDARDLLVLVPCERSPGLVDVVTVCVIAPEGADEVEVGGVRAPVRDRVAVVRFPEPRPVDGLRATARRADGEVLGPVRRADGERAATDAALPWFGGRRLR